MKTDTNTEAGSDCQQRLVRIVRRFNYHVEQHEGGWHQNICADVEFSDGEIQRSNKQATLYTFDYPTKDACIEDAMKIIDLFNANVKERDKP